MFNAPHCHSIFLSKLQGGADFAKSAPVFRSLAWT